MTFNVLYDVHKACSGNNCSRTYNLCETTTGFCVNMDGTSRITTSDPPTPPSCNCATTECPITTCPTCSSYTEWATNQENVNTTIRVTTVNDKVKHTTDTNDAMDKVEHAMNTNDAMDKIKHALDTTKAMDTICPSLATTVTVMYGK